MRAAPPNGYTLYLATGSSLAQNPALWHDLNYDPLKDFALVGLEATIPGILFVNVDPPVRSLDDPVAYAAAHPNALNYGSDGQGTAGHLTMEALSAFVGPSALPAAIVTRLNETINTVSRMPEVTGRMRVTLHADPAVTTPASFRTFVESELAKWKLIWRTVKISD